MQVSPPKFKKATKPAFVLKNQVKLEQYDIKQSFEDLPHWSSSKAFPPNSYIPTVFLPPLNRNHHLTRTGDQNYFNNSIQSKSTTSINKSSTNELKAKAARSDQNYWNDWFGKPGHGAPIYTSYKQNLEYMLEPKRYKDHEKQKFEAKYTDLDMHRFGSNHHNHYELN